MLIITSPSNVRIRCYTKKLCSVEQTLHTMVHNRTTRIYLWCSVLKVIPKQPAKVCIALNKTGGRRVFLPPWHGV